MIGVIASPDEYAVVRELFELFKTPWEFYRSGKQYDVLLCAGNGEFAADQAELVLLYAGGRLPYDGEEGIEIASQGPHLRMLSYKEHKIPIYGENLTFREGCDVLIDQESKRPAMCFRRTHSRTVVRVGYDIFAEIRVLLTAGQPAVNAAIPALELHIALLRDLIVANGIELAEIPPVPEGYRFIACLTHDIDHPSLRRHKFDHTALGFVYRAVFGSLGRVLIGRMSPRALLRNWGAALKLPLVHLGLAKDFWHDFDRYVQLEAGARSTFFIIPFKNCPGRLGERSAPRLRAAGYGAADIADKIRILMATGCEIGLHGIDAWLDSASGSVELEEVGQITGNRDIGVRMHWLYYDAHTPSALDRAGAKYDSTVGYNDTVGYRAGTTQVYRPLGTTQLLEVPLHIMDTALFFPSHLGLSPREARERTASIIEKAVKFGGVVTVNWHDRSIAPERCWGDFYMDLLREFKRAGAWLATADEAVAWFRTRRAVTFDGFSADGDVPLLRTADRADGLPGLQVRVYEGRGTAAVRSTVQIGSHS